MKKESIEDRIYRLEILERIRKKQQENKKEIISNLAIFSLGIIVFIIFIIASIFNNPFLAGMCYSFLYIWCINILSIGRSFLI